MRTLCAVFVVFEHFCEISDHNALGFTLASSMPAHIMLRLMYGIARVAVPCFFLISGYLSIESKKQKIWKVAGLYTMTVFYSLIPFLADRIPKIIDGSFTVGYAFIRQLASLLLPQNYYLFLFCAVYILSPYLNKFVSTLSKKQYLKLLVTLFVLYSVWSSAANALSGWNGTDFTGIYFTSRTGTSNGFNVVNFAMLYLIGGYIKLHHTPDVKKDRIVSVCAALICTSLAAVFAMTVPSISKFTYYYDSVFITVGAISLLLLFTTFKIKGGLILCTTGKNTFGTYLIHAFASACIERFVSIEKVVSKGFFGALLGILIFVIGTYLLSLLIAFVISFIFKPIHERIKKAAFYSRLIYKEE